MQITVSNCSNQPDTRVLQVIRAINRQIREDFRPYWSMDAQLRLSRRPDGPVDPQHLADLRGDAVLYLFDDVQDEADAGILGFHDENLRGVPFGFVFTEISDRLGEDWSITLSHEALELLGDPDVNRLAAGPDPRDPRDDRKFVLFWYEMCDAVQDQSYEIDGIPVSNFVLPDYFTLGEQPGGRNDFLGGDGAGQQLQSFGVAPGGYVGFMDPADGVGHTFPADRRAKDRLAIKSTVDLPRRFLRYSRLPQRAAGEGTGTQLGPKE